MHSQRLTSVLLVFSGLLGATLFAASPPEPPQSESEYSRRVWRIQEGLPEGRIQALAQTPDQYLWIGTSGGLVRFDGVRFAIFNRSNTPAFRDDSILALCPARDGSLWIGTEGGGLLHLIHGDFQVFGASEGLSNGFVRAIKEDRQGALCVGTDRGFFRHDSGKFLRLDGQNGAPVLSVRDIFQSSDGRLWVEGSSLLMQVEGGSLRQLFPSATTRPLSVQRISEAPAGALWLGTQLGLARLRDGRIEPYRGTEKANVQTLYANSEDDLWIGTLAQGLLRLRAGLLTTYQAPAMLPDNTIGAVVEDRERSLWIGTQDGLVRFSKKTASVLAAREGLADENVVSIYGDRDGALWIATITGRLYRVTGRTAVPFALPDESLRARTVFRDSQGGLWIGSLNRGAVRLSGGKATPFNIATGLRSNSIRSFCEDRQGNIWIATGSGLSRWDGRKLRNYYLEDGLAYGSVRVVMLDSVGDLVVGTDGGANRMRDGKFVPDSLLAQLGSERIWTLHQDAQGGLWLGTRSGGLFRVKQGKVTRYTTRDGLLSDSIFQLLEDGQGRIWMSGSAGISSVDRKELDAMAEGKRGPLPVVPYGAAEGLESSEMNGGVQPAGYRTASGELWFPSVKGAVRIDPRLLRPNIRAPILIEALLVDDRSVPLSGPIHIPPGRARLEIQYTACNLLSPERLTFRYKLEGFDENWTQAAARRTAYYTNLPAREYRFRVLASDAAAPESVSETSLTFVRDPYFHETGWFYGLCALLAGAVGYGGFRLYARQTRAHFNSILGERVRLAREMHDTVIQGCVGVSTLLEAAFSVDRADPAKTKDLLDQARTQVRLTLEEARQAVWDLRRETPAGDLAATLSDFARRLSGEKGIPVEVEIVGLPAPLDEGTERNLLLVAREAMRNAVAHAAPTKIGIRLCFEQKEIHLEVTDDGRGFVPSEVGLVESGHYGIAGMRERIAQLRGSFELNSAPGAGTKVIARVPLAGHLEKRKPARESHEQI
jgi:ligand-binding sensor domain-containing protein/signal transduction histidine kinase